MAAEYWVENLETKSKIIDYTLDTLTKRERKMLDCFGYICIKNGIKRPSGSLLGILKALKDFNRK